MRNTEQRTLNGEELYLSLAHAVKTDNIEGIQQIRSIWRIYLKTQDDRVRLIMDGLPIRGAVAPIHDLNPLSREKEEYLTKLTVKDIPLSVSDELIKAELEAKKYEVKGAIIRQKLRVNGQLINCYNGDRVVYIRPPSQPLPRKFVLANSFVARIFHLGQPKTVLTCSKCLGSGHHASTCNAEVRCRKCKESGHVQSSCTAASSGLHNPRGPETAPGKTQNGSPREGILSDMRSNEAGTNESNKARDAPRQTTLADFMIHTPQNDSVCAASSGRDSGRDHNQREAMATRSSRRAHDRSNVNNSTVDTNDTDDRVSSREVDGDTSDSSSDNDEISADSDERSLRMDHKRKQLSSNKKNQKTKGKKSSSKGKK